MGNGIYVILVILAIQAISSYLAHRKKQQIRKAQMEAARHRSLRTEAGDQTNDESGLITAPETMTAQGGDLEARRRAQLEQLRQRRETRRTGTSQPPIVASSQPQMRQGAPVARSGPVVVAPTLGTSDQARIKAQEAARRAREAERQRRDQEARIAAQREEYEDAARRLAASRARSSDTPVADDPIAATDISTSSAAALGRLGGSGRVGAAATGLIKRLKDPVNLREIIVLREVLDTPVGLRAQDAGARPFDG